MGCIFLLIFSPTILLSFPRSKRTPEKMLQFSCLIKQLVFFFHVEYFNEQDNRLNVERLFKAQGPRCWEYGLEGKGRAPLLC